MQYYICEYIGVLKRYINKSDMKKARLILACAVAMTMTSCANETPTNNPSLKPEPGKTRNLLLEAGYSQEQIDTKLNETFYNLFEGPNKIYFEVEDSMAYISDIKNHDVRRKRHSGRRRHIQLWRYNHHFCHIKYRVLFHTME